MFESAELGHAIDKATFDRAEPRLRKALLAAQYELKDKPEFPVIVVFAGLDAAGKSETANLLNEWLDPRLIETRAFDAPTEEERERPRMWRYFRALPPKGKIGFTFLGWYTEPLIGRFEKRIDREATEQLLAENARFERMLVHDGALVLKFWFHISKDQQKKRLKKLSKDPRTRWRVGDEAWEHLAGYDRFKRTGEQVLRATDSGEAPWVIVEGSDERYRNLTVARALVHALRAHLDRAAPLHEPDPPPLLAPADGLEVLDRLDLSLSLPKANYATELETLQGRVNMAMRSPRFRKRHSVVAVFEGNDAAGKGGSIRRVTAALDVRQYEVASIAAPNDEERLHPYLWRFWRRLPRRGELTIFDRSWYGRVLVERVEKLASERDWMRAYSEIVDFEQQLVAHGVIVVKFWLSVSKDEQLRRFQERESVAWKNFKITPEDYRNRKKWGAYAAAVNDMVERTSTDVAPWTLVEANDKRYARVKVLRTLVEAIEQKR